MSKKQILTAVIVLFLIALVWVIKGDRGNKGELINPAAKPAANQTAQPAVSTYNPPVEIKYDSSTDLTKELDSINPQVNESDFAP